MSASKLWEMARALKTTVAYFYEGLSDTPGLPATLPPDPVQEFLLTSEGLELANAFPRIRQARVRRKVLDLVRAMAEEPEPARA